LEIGEARRALLKAVTLDNDEAGLNPFQATAARAALVLSAEIPSIREVPGTEWRPCLLGTSLALSAKGKAWLKVENLKSVNRRSSFPRIAERPL
jgi:hypothetical protein